MTEESYVPEGILCKDCSYRKEKWCTRFNFSADPEHNFPWCKSGEYMSGTKE